MNPLANVSLMLETYKKTMKAFSIIPYKMMGTRHDSLKAAATRERVGQGLTSLVEEMAANVESFKGL